MKSVKGSRAGVGDREVRFVTYDAENNFHAWQNSPAATRGDVLGATGGDVLGAMLGLQAEHAESPEQLTHAKDSPKDPLDASKVMVASRVASRHARLEGRAWHPNSDRGLPGNFLTNFAKDMCH